VFVLVVGSVIGLFYYLRIIVVMAAPAQATTAAGRGRLAWAAYPALAILTIALIWLGIYPAPLIALIRLTTLHVG
jgi:NADH-quinone oxidoreductase subunit N